MSEVAVVGDDITSKYNIGKTNPDELIRKKGMKYLRNVSRDTHVSSQLRTRKQKLLAKGWTIHPASDSKTDKEIATFVLYTIMDMEGSLEQDISGMLSGIGYGFSLTEIVYKQISKGPFQGKIGLNGLHHKPQENFKFDQDKYGNVEPDGILLMKGYSTATADRLQRNKFIHYIYGDDDNPYGDSTLSKVAFWAWLKKNMIQFWAIYGERFGMPVVMGEIPPNAQPADKTAIESIVNELQSRSGITVPEGFKLSFLEAVRNGDVKYDNAIERCNKEISKEIVGQTLSAEEGKRGQGSYALSSTHENTLDDYIEFDARQVATCLNEQLIRRLVDYNWDVDQYPEFAFVPEPNMVVVIQNLDILVNSMQIPASWLHKKLNIPMAQNGEAVLLPSPSLGAKPQGLDNNARAFSEQRVQSFATIETTSDKDKYVMAGGAAVDELLRLVNASSGKIFTKMFDYVMKQLRSSMTEGEAFEILPNFSVNVSDLKNQLLDVGIWSWFAGQWTAFKITGEIKSFADESLTLKFGTAEEAWEQFQGLVPVTRAQYDAMMEVYTDRFFTVSGMTQDDIKKVFDSAGLALEEGWTWDEFDNAIASSKAEWVVPGGVSTGSRSRLVFQNAMMRSFRDGENAMFNDPEVADTIWGYRYMAILDGRQRDNHGKLNGITRAKDDPFWRSYDPPWDHGCRCNKVPVFTWEIDEKTEIESETVPDVSGGFMGDQS